MSDLVDIYLRGIPLKLQQQASEHFDELIREFGDLAASDAPRDGKVPERLLALNAALRERFSSFTERQEANLADGLRRGDKTMDLHYRVPRDVGDAVNDLAAMLDEADAYCEAGEHLLTLRTAPGPLAYRRWFFAQFAGQVKGAAPLDWPTWAATHAPGLPLT